MQTNQETGKYIFFFFALPSTCRIKLDATINIQLGSFWFKKAVMEMGVMGWGRSRPRKYNYYDCKLARSIATLEYQTIVRLGLA